MATHEGLKLMVSGSVVAVQPAGAAGGKVETLLVDMVAGDVKLNAQPALPSGCEEALAVVGAFRLRGGTAVAVVTGAQKVRGRGPGACAGAGACVATRRSWGWRGGAGGRAPRERGVAQGHDTRVP